MLCVLFQKRTGDQNLIVDSLFFFGSPYLTWRDLQHIVVLTARKGNLEADDWVLNGVRRPGRCHHLAAITLLLIVLNTLTLHIIFCHSNCQLWYCLTNLEDRHWWQSGCLKETEVRAVNVCSQMMNTVLVKKGMFLFIQVSFSDHFLGFGYQDWLGCNVLFLLQWVITLVMVCWMLWRWLTSREAGATFQNSVAVKLFQNKLQGSQEVCCYLLKIKKYWVITIDGYKEVVAFKWLLNGCIHLVS